MNDFLIIFAALSAALILARSKVLGFLPRNKLYFLRCLQCLGAWVGFALAYWIHPEIKAALLVGLGTSGAGYIFNRLFPEIRINLSADFDN